MVVLKKLETEESVYDAALARIRLLYDRFDRVVVSFSGGKDSTVALNLALIVARERGRLPLDVYTFDEEAIHTETVEYLARVAANPDIDFKWFCVPIKHRNACSTKQVWWYPWHPDDRDKWVRPLPEGAITELPGLVHGNNLVECVHNVYRNDGFTGTIAHVRGIRASESLSRYRSVTHRVDEAWISEIKCADAAQKGCSPIYDWTTNDVWVAPQVFGWDYNHTYDVMSQMGITPHDQRVCPPFGEEPLRSLWIYSQAWPELWERMINRVPGANTALRYSETNLYGFGKTELPPGHTWQSYTFQTLDRYSVGIRGQIAANIKQVMGLHQGKTSRPIHEFVPDPVSGCSWEFLCNLAIRADLKRRRAVGMATEASKSCAAMGITVEDALAMAEADLSDLYYAYLETLKNDSTKSG